jgi:hypothetical protein
MVKPRYTRPDDNHNDIVRTIKQIPGLDVIDLRDIGIKGVPDILIGYRGKNYLVEIKTNTGRMSPEQAEHHHNWPGQTSVAWSIEAVLRIIGLEK